MEASKSAGGPPKFMTSKKPELDTIVRNPVKIEEKPEVKEFKKPVFSSTKKVDNNQ